MRLRRRRDAAYETQHAALDDIGARLLDTDDPPDAAESERQRAALLDMGPVRGSFGDRGRRGGIGRPGHGCGHLAPYPGCCRWDR